MGSLERQILSQLHHPDMWALNFEYLGIGSNLEGEGFIVSRNRLLWVVGSLLGSCSLRTERLVLDETQTDALYDTDTDRFGFGSAVLPHFIVHEAVHAIQDRDYRWFQFEVWDAEAIAFIADVIIQVKRDPGKPPSYWRDAFATSDIERAAFEFCLSQRLLFSGRHAPTRFTKTQLEPAMKAAVLAYYPNGHYGFNGVRQRRCAR